MARTSASLKSNKGTSPFLQLFLHDPARPCRPFLGSVPASPEVPNWHLGSECRESHDDPGGALQILRTTAHHLKPYVFRAEMLSVCHRSKLYCDSSGLVSMQPKKLTALRPAQFVLARSLRADVFSSRASRGVGSLDRCPAPRTRCRMKTPTFYLPG